MTVKHMLIVPLLVIAITNITTGKPKVTVEKKPVEKAIVLHEGLSMALELALEEPTGYRINKMTKTGNKPYTGIVIAKSGKAYQASCTITELMGEKFALPCNLKAITKTEVQH